VALVENSINTIPPSREAGCWLYVYQLHCGIDFVGLYPRMCNRPYLQRIGDDHFSDVRSQRVHDRSRIAGRFQHDLVAGTQAIAKFSKLVNRQTYFAAKKNCESRRRNEPPRGRTTP
jgi:hypothetical protein